MDDMTREHTACYGTMFPDTLHLSANEEIKGRVFSHEGAPVRSGSDVDPTGESVLGFEVLGRQAGSAQGLQEGHPRHCLKDRRDPPSDLSRQDRIPKDEGGHRLNPQISTFGN